jgi:hypothetical protein
MALLSLLSLSDLRATFRRRACSLATAIFILICTASFFGPPVLLVLPMWLVTGFVLTRVWSSIECKLLLWRGCCEPARLERERLAALPADSARQLLVLDSSAPYVLHGARHVVVSRAAFDLLEDRALLGLLTQATDVVWQAAVAGELLVWWAMLPLLAGLLVSAALSRLGRGVAVLIGWSLVLPLVFWPAGFVRWMGRALSGLFGALLGTMLISSGLPGAGMVLLVSWLAVPAMQLVLRWEWRQAEAVADRATIEAGLGWHLLEALELFSWVEPLPRPDGLVGLLFRLGAPLSVRAERVWRSVGPAAT